jgi:hypothetical protein
MGDHRPVDFRQWLCVELERERVQTILAPASCSTRGAIQLSELEATALLFLALDVEHHSHSDHLASVLADRLADALYSRLLDRRLPGSAFDASNIQTSDNHQGDEQ